MINKEKISLVNAPLNIINIKKKWARPQLNNFKIDMNTKHNYTFGSDGGASLNSFS